MKRASESAAAEDWRALFHEGARRLAMIFRQPGLDLVPCFEIEEFAQRAALWRKARASLSN